MAEDERVKRAIERATAGYESDYVPNIGTPEHPMSQEARQTHALEYIAYQLGQITQALRDKS